MTPTVTTVLAVVVTLFIGALVLAFRKHPCPCCEAPGVVNKEGQNDLCEVCGWIDDPKTRQDPSYVGPPNRMTIETARGKYWARKADSEGGAR